MHQKFGLIESPKKMRKPKGCPRIGLLLVAIAVAWALGVVYFCMSLMASHKRPVNLTQPANANSAALEAKVQSAGFPSSGSHVQLSAATNLGDHAPLDSSKALRAASECPSPYWRPEPALDKDFHVPYASFGPRKKFVTYEVDYGGFNNVRMTLETLLVFAKATGRTIVLPPKSPIYLLKPKHNSTAAGKAASKGGPKGVAERAAPLVSAVDYFREGIEALQRDKVVDVLTFQEFVQSESQAPGGVVYDAALRIQAAVEADHSWATSMNRGNADGVSPKKNKNSKGASAAALSGVGVTPAELRDLLLSWNTAAEEGDDAARKRIRAWLRLALCAPRPSLKGTKMSTSSNRVHENRQLSTGGALATTIDGSPENNEAVDLEEDTDEKKELIASQARCPRWEPLKECVVFGDVEKALSSWPLNPLVAHAAAHRYTSADFATPRRRMRPVDGLGAGGEAWVHMRTDMGLTQGQPARPLFTHWSVVGYTFFLFADYATDLYMKRLIRDYAHYDARIFCVAARIRKRLDQEAAALLRLASSERSPHAGNNNGNSNSSSGSGAVAGAWSSFHVRHGELQYTNVQVSPATLLEATAPWLGGAQASQELLYIATDESTLAWFEPLKSRHPHLRFLHDFKEETAGLPSDLLGMVEQAVAAGGRTFTGTWFSTFSAYVCRLRGYQGERNDDSCYVFAPAQKRFDFQEWKMPQHAFYPREWALAWEGIDFRPSRDPSTASGMQLPMGLEFPFLDFPGAAKLVYPSAAVAKAAAARSAEVEEAQKGST